MLRYAFFLFFCTSALLAKNPCPQAPCSDIMPDIAKDLCLVHAWNKIINDRLPLYTNYSGATGYFQMPSALVPPDGQFSFAYAYIPPYRNWTLSFQMMENLEMSGAYRIFYGVQDANLSPFGFGDYADKGINFKICFFKPEDSNYTLPAFSFGWDDFLGSRMFQGLYIAFTQVILPAHLEVTAGWGWERYGKFFAAAAWSPFHACNNPYIKDLTLVAELDNTRYTDPKYEPHPKGRIVHCRVNPGIRYRPFKYLDVTASWMRGTSAAASAAFHYPIGQKEGLLPKIKDPLPYRRPINIEPSSGNRDLIEAVEQMALTMQNQGFLLKDAYLTCDAKEKKALRLRIVNQRYFFERTSHKRISSIIAALTPSDMEEVFVVMQDQGLDTQQYRFRQQDLQRFRLKQIGQAEIDVLSPRKTVERCALNESFFHHRLPFIKFSVEPTFRTYFGSSQGKFKYVANLSAFMNGYLPWQWIYDASVNYVLYSTASDIQDMDKLNPSQLLNVHTDLINYSNDSSLQLDHFYLQRSLNLGNDWFARLSGGYFEIAYAGSAVEFLYYPPKNRFAIGLEAALLKKRAYKGLGFQHSLRKLNGYTPTYVPYFFLHQFFLDFYYSLEAIPLELKLSAGKFLARDWGARTELSRLFKNGLKISVWYTFTNGKDQVNNSEYFDKGIAFSLPLDFFYKKHSRDTCGYGMAAWLRDVGYRSNTGERLYQILQQNRF